MKDTDDISARKLIDKLVPDPRWGSMRGELPDGAALAVYQPAHRVGDVHVGDVDQTG